MLITCFNINKYIKKKKYLQFAMLCFCKIETTHAGITSILQNMLFNCLN